MRNQTARLVLFVLLETLAISLMIMLFTWSREAHCWNSPYHHHDCRDPSSAGLLLAIPIMLAELAFVASVLRVEQPIWGFLVMLGLVAPVFGVGMLVMTPIFEPGHVMGTVALWHASAGLLLLGAGLVGGVHAAFARWHRAHEGRRGLAAGEA